LNPSCHMNLVISVQQGANSKSLRSYPTAGQKISSQFTYNCVLYFQL